MRAAAARAIEIAEGVDRSDLQVNSVETLAPAHLVEILGEAANAVSIQLKERYPELPWKQMVAARNRIIHGYHTVNLDTLWRIVTNELRRVVELLDDVISAEGFPDPES